MKKIITVFMRVKKATAWLLIASFLLAFLASCNTQPPKESENDTTSTTEQTENNPFNDISNEEKYKSVLDIYKDVIINLDEQMNSKGSPYSEGTKEYEWWAAIIRALSAFYFSTTIPGYPHLSTNIPGYAFCDLNKNGNDEMVLLLDDYTVLAIFSFTDGKPVLLDNYWNRKKCTIEQDGTIQVYGSGGADRSAVSIYEIAKNDKELVLLEEYGTDGHDPDTLVTHYYKVSSGNKTPITVLEYAAALSLYQYVESLAEHTKENASFEFVPLELDYKRVFEKILNYEMKINSEDKYLWEFYFSFGTNSIGSLESVEICYLDMDGDGISELLLKSNIHDHLILRYHCGTVYLYEYSYKEMARVYEDGSYSWSSPTYLEDYSHQYGISMLSFNENRARASSLYTIYDGENESYFIIDKKFASKTELDALIESRKNIKEVTWTTYTLDPNKIPAKG